MYVVSEEKYEDWTIRILRQSSMESRFSYEIIDSAGHTKHVDPGGNSPEDARERAKEMIDEVHTGSKYGVS